ncbi:MAG: SAM-dependent methyltransferase, partial [Flavobacteriales bacterium CG_4_9_14_0_2_um_filter_32_27]
VFFDGNHTKNATLTYFNWCLEKANEQSVFVFDDIYWSEEMKCAWKEIKAHPKVTTTIDLFFLGIIFFNPDLSKEDFVLRF